MPNISVPEMVMTSSLIVFTRLGAWGQSSTVFHRSSLIDETIVPQEA